MIRGIPYAMSPSANRLHQDVARNTLRMLMNALESNSCDCKIYYALDLILATNTVVRPDLMIFCEEIEGDYPNLLHH
ncbi:MAG: Uma2 family endonuclease [Saprospiraceae bacterium]|nr:Uma2 family endonuclease [Saprospiraceae bacterium]